MPENLLSMRRYFSAFAFTLLFLILACNQVIPATAFQKSADNQNKVTGIDAARAYAHVKKMTEIGPHPPGSKEIKKAQEYIESELKTYGVKVINQEFVADTTRGKVPMKNIIGELPGQKPDIVIIAGHYDTKLQADFMGANDGGSSTAAVLEMARVLAPSKPEYTLWFVFFDGEEAFIDWSENDGKDNTYGSRYMASKMTSEGSIKRVKAMILVDMIGDKDLDLLRDEESTPWLVDIIWNTARKIGYEKHFLSEQGAYADDHLPFKEAGVPVIDIIDFNYGPDNAYWHTNKDTLDKVSGESIKIVCDTVIQSLPEVFKQLSTRRQGNGK
jgi:Zn-dependent M28 family amino/carboxypeptidase